ncbi:DNA/RNA non-specific endonuclease, partial [Bacillus nitratireducens]|uniref:DNA/RNA non-specific endonuclease n=1 Tax=Bacillus nitratireducens TaxID=2026193 RepID=UPI002E783D8F
AAFGKFAEGTKVFQVAAKNSKIVGKLEEVTALMNKLPDSIVEKIKNIEIPNLFPEPVLAGGGNIGERKTLGELFSAGTEGTVNRTVNGTGGASGVKTLVGAGEHFTNGRKNRLKPDIRYKTGEFDYFYETDSLGRIEKFETDKLQLTEREKRLSHSKNTLGKVKGEDNAGHVAGDRFGGSPKLDNLVSQLEKVNKSIYKRIENQWATALEEGKHVKVNVEIKYDGVNLRPSEFNIQYEIDGKYFERDILNSKGDYDE